MDNIENDYIKFWIKDGLLFSKHKKVVSIGLEEAKEIIQLRHEISNNVSQYWCMDFRNLKSSTREAHDYVDKNGQEYLHACGAIVNSYLTKFTIDLFNKIKKPKVPLKTFLSQESAIKWLNEIKENNQTE